MNTDIKYALLNIVQTLAAFITVLVFLTGLSSLPDFLGRSWARTDMSVEPGLQLNSGILVAFSSEVQITISLLALPLFCMFNAWFIASVAKAFMYFLDYLEINAALSERLFSGLLLLPVAVGLNMALMIILFGSSFEWLPIVLGLLCLSATSLLLGKPRALVELLAKRSSARAMQRSFPKDQE